MPSVAFLVLPTVGENSIVRFHSAPNHVWYAQAVNVSGNEILLELYIELALGEATPTLHLFVGFSTLVPVLSSSPSLITYSAILGIFQMLHTRLLAQIAKIDLKT